MLTDNFRYAESWKCLRKATSRNVLKRHGNFFRPSKPMASILGLYCHGDEIWVHSTTPEMKEQFRQWKHPGLQKFKQTLTAGKVMTSVFWYRKGLLIPDFLPAYNSQCGLLL
ncbi:hypothetical protein TNIN_229061 [Trichonephila inaurata madagascariensis]|uniref:Transposase n=1 Tax=Trichonephila inaurata madagascariensis TaxID=2747483 RepID=A0A8X6YSX5_9ARAC|nr:hypothetical protein TNIN_229061 [Trichonephila inaurata madagascariensis]